MLSEINRLRLTWISRARAGDMLPQELFNTDASGNGWGVALSDAARAALDEIGRLQQELARRASEGAVDDRIGSHNSDFDINKWRP